MRSESGPVPGVKTKKHYYRVDRRQISFIKFIFEAYEGVAVITTIDAGQGRIVLSVSPQCEQLSRRIMADLGKKMLIEPCDDPSAQGVNEN
jgi:hypothetical protein